MLTCKFVCLFEKQLQQKINIYRGSAFVFEKGIFWHISLTRRKWNHKQKQNRLRGFRKNIHTIAEFCHRNGSFTKNFTGFPFFASVDEKAIFLLI
jgi:hypothetical protein